MLFAVTVLAIVAIVAIFMAVSFRIQLSMMRLRATYWENVVRQNSMIRHQWLQKNEPAGPFRTLGKSIRNFYTAQIHKN